MGPSVAIPLPRPLTAAQGAEIESWIRAMAAPINDRGNGWDFWIRDLLPLGMPPDHDYKPCTFSLAIARPETVDTYASREWTIDADARVYLEEERRSNLALLGLRARAADRVLRLVQR